MTRAGPLARTICPGASDGDHDGYVDGEDDWDTDPGDFDSDDDGIDDGTEVRDGTDPLTALPNAGLYRNWLFYNSPLYSSPTWELVPGLWQRFLMIDDETGTNEIYFLAPSNLVRTATTSLRTQLRISYFDPDTSATKVYRVDGESEPFTSVTISAASGSFHGVPTMGSSPVDVYRLRWTQPPYPYNAIQIFYAPIVQAFSNRYATDIASNNQYTNGWSNSFNGGSGWLSGWALTNSSTNISHNGHFIGDSSTNGNGDINSDGDINTTYDKAFGLYANNGEIAAAVRKASSSVAVGQTVSLDLDNGYIDSSGTVGIGLQNELGENRFEFYFVGGQDHYTLNDGRGSLNSQNPVHG